jgi:SAM-dependent methyltransferase
MPESESTWSYTLGTGAVEQERLRAQADDLRPHSDDLFGLIGVKPGWSTLDLGCGPRGNLGLLAELTGPDGCVLGLDANPDNVRLAREFAAALGLAHVRTAVADARSTGLPGCSFDLVYARLLLYRAAGLEDVGFHVFADAHPAGHRRRTIIADLARSLRPKILDREVITERELDELDRAVRSHIADPGTVMLPVLYFTAWGRKPA